MNPQASFTFTTPLNVNIVELKDGEHLFVEGDISTNDIDIIRDVMDKHCQESMQRQVLERNMKLDVEHEAFRGKTHEEKEINKTKIPAGKLIDAVIKDLGKDRYSTRVKGEINRHHPERYKALKGDLLDEYLDAFSVAFLPISVKYKDDDGKEISYETYKSLPHDQRIRVLHDVLLLNVALTGNPCNTKAQVIDIVTKSMDSLEDYKKLKELDPSIEDQLIVKANKENPLSYIWNKIMSGQVLNKKEIRLLKAVMDVADNKGTYSTLTKELFDKVSRGEKLTYKEYYIFKELLQVDYPELEVPIMAETMSKKSHSSDLVGKNQLNKNKNKKMTDNKDDKPEGEGEGENQDPEKPEGDESTNAEQKAMFKSVSEEMKTLSEKYDAVSKENVGLKEDMKAISENLTKITEALANPIHKSPGVQLTDAQIKAKAEAEDKSVDPLDACN